MEWTSKIDIRQGETPEYGCIVGANDKVQVQGSNAGALSDDLNRQFTALAAWLNTPGSFTGTFGEAIEETKRQAKVLLDKIAEGKLPTVEELGKYKNVCKALKKGMETWKEDIQRQFPSPTPPEIAQVLANIGGYSAQLQDLLDCKSSGYNYKFHDMEVHGGPNDDFDKNNALVVCDVKAGQKVAENLLTDLSNILYDLPQKFASSEFLVGNDEGCDNITKLCKNACGEYLLLHKVRSNPIAGISHEYIPPRGKKAISTFFTNNVEYYQYLLFRVLHSDEMGCKNFILGNDTYLDQEFFKKRDKLLLFLASNYSWKFSYTTRHQVNSQQEWEAFKVDILEQLVDDSQNQAVAVEWIEEVHSNLQAETLGSILGAVTAPDGLIIESGSSAIVTVAKAIRSTAFGSKIILGLSKSLTYSKSVLKIASQTKVVAKFANLIKNLIGAEKILSIEGKFIDFQLESDYVKYLARKATQQKAPRGRLEWKDARDYWLNDSPLARGNAFNRKAWDERWYPFWEVYLENGKFVDGYNPITKEIISRKATLLEEIELSTFEKYLKEMNSKYSPGKIIKSKKVGYEVLFDKPLQGKQILEIPISNQNFSQIQQYIDLAKNNYNIEIRFRPE